MKKKHPAELDYDIKLEQPELDSSLKLEQPELDSDIKVEQLELDSDMKVEQPELDSDIEVERAELDLSQLESYGKSPFSKMDRTAPLNEHQRVMLLSIIKKHETAVSDRSTGALVVKRKRAAWDAIAFAFNNMYPDDELRTPLQLKRSFEHVKRKVKQEDRNYKKKLSKTGGGPPPDFPRLSEELVIAASMMSQELAMPNDLYETFVHPVNEGEPIYDVHIGINKTPHSASRAVPHGVPPIPSVHLITTSDTSNIMPTAQDNSSPSTTSSVIFPSRSHSPTPPVLTDVQTQRPSTAKKRLQAEYDKCQTRQEETHRLRMEIMKREHEMAEEIHKLKLKYYENKIATCQKINTLIDEGQNRVLESLNKFDAVLDTAKVVYEAMSCP